MYVCSSIEYDPRFQSNKITTNVKLNFKQTENQQITHIYLKCDYLMQTKYNFSFIIIN